MSPIAEKEDYNAAIATARRAKNIAVTKGNMEKLITSMDMSMETWKTKKSN